MASSELRRATRKSERGRSQPHATSTYDLCTVTQRIDGRAAQADAREDLGDDALERDLLEGVGALPRHRSARPKDFVADRLGAVAPRLLQRQAA